MNRWFSTWCGDKKKKRLVADLRMKAVSERKLAALRLLGRKNVNRRLPSSLRNAEGHPVEDRSCWRSLIHEHFGRKFRRDDVQNPETTRSIWKRRVCGALQCGKSPGELSFEEFQEVLLLVKPDVAMGRDNVLETILRFLPGSVQIQLYSSIVERLAGREDAHVKSWAEFDVCLVPKKGDISKLSNWRPISFVPTLYKVHEMCVWKVLDKELRPLPGQLVGFRPGMQCLDIVSFLVESLRKADEWGEELFIVSMDVASAFDSVSAQVLGDVLLERGATTISAAASGERKLGAPGPSVSRVHKECFVQSGRGHETGRPKNTFQLEPGHGGVGRGIAGPGSVLSYRMGAVRNFWYGPTTFFLVFSSTVDVAKRTLEIAEVFGKRGLRFNQSRLEILPSKKAEGISLNERMEFTWVQILVPGCYLDGSSSTETQVKGRLDQVRKMFSRLRPMPCCSKIPEEERIRTFYTAVASSVLWGSGCWIPSTKTQELISIQETRWLRCMLGGRKAQDVQWMDLFRATKRSAQALRCRLNFPSLWHRALAAMYGWAGHVARKDESHPGHAANRWRNADWWEIMKSTGAGSRDQTWRHR